MGRILAYLESGVDLRLALTAFKGQISALVALFSETKIALHSLVHGFLQVDTCIIPPHRTPWDLNFLNYRNLCFNLMRNIL